MDIRKVKKLIELLEESGISEIEIHEGEESVRISRGSTIAAPAPVVYDVPPPPVSPSAPKPTTPTVVEEDDIFEGHVVKSPMVGVFYGAPSPEDDDFVKVGQSVSKGAVVCIIEAMKIMNQIESDVSGTVSRILVANGDPIEYGQPLFIIDEA